MVQAGVLRPMKSSDCRSSKLNFASLKQAKTGIIKPASAHHSIIELLSIPIGEMVSNL